MYETMCTISVQQSASNEYTLKTLLDRSSHEQNNWKHLYPDDELEDHTDLEISDELCAMIYGTNNYKIKSQELSPTHHITEYVLHHHQDHETQYDPHLDESHEDEESNNKPYSRENQFNTHDTITEPVEDINDLDFEWIEEE